MSNDQGADPQNPGQQPPAYPGVPQQPGYPGAAPTPPPVVPPVPRYPGAAPQQPLPPQAAPGQPAPGYPGTAPGYPAPAQTPYGQPGAPTYGQPGTPAYGQPGAAVYAQPYGQPYAAPTKSNGLAITALICGIVGLVFFWLAYVVVPFAASIVAIITGHMALGRIKRDPALGGKGMALTGLILGYVGAVLNLIVGAIVIIGFLYVASYNGNY